jgi:hypothetical protein
MIATLRKAICCGILLCLGLYPGLAAAVKPGPQAGPQTSEAFFGQIQALLQKRDLAGYLDLVSPDIRNVELARLATFFGKFKMDSVRLRLAGKRADEDGGTRLYCQAYFENTYSVMLESWQLTLAGRDGRWEVAGKEILGHASTLYKIRIPAGRSDHVRSVEITHRDIRLAFKDAAVFYDNLPDFHTAFLIIGNGTVRFSPSDAIEKHQLELVYKRPFLEDAIDFVYVRCSNSFASSNIKITPGEGLPAVSQAETDRAALLFSKSYPRSFTIESVLGKEFLSILPEGDEAVFDFRGRRAGDLSYIYYPFSEEPVSLYDRSRERIISLYRPADNGETQSKNLYLGFADRFDIDRYQLDLSYSPFNSYLSGKARISIVPRTGSLDTIKLRFNPDLEILKIYDQEKRELFFTRDRLRKLLYVDFISPPVLQKPTWIEVYYRGRMSPPPPTTDVIAQAASRSKFIFRPRYETFFFSQSGLWYPEPPEEDYFLARLKLIIPPEYKCVANGELVENGRWNEMGDVAEIEKTGSSIYIFETKSPIKYMSFIVGKFDRVRDLTEPVPIQTSISTEIMEGAPSLPDVAKRILDYYIRSFGPYPYEKLGIVKRLFPTAGGHSPASFVVLNEVPWLGNAPYPMTSDSPVNLSDWDDYFLAHEIAHQWWGQGVSFTTYKDQWLSEGLAQFAAVSYLRDRYGERTYAAILKKFASWTVKKSEKGPITFGSRLSFFDFEAYQTIVYDKAAMVLFMLQDLLGRNVFFAGLKEFFATFKYSSARTDSFIAVMERVSGKDLKDFSQGWFRSYELPVVQTAWSEGKTASGSRLKIRVTQTRGRFVFPLWIEWTSRGQTHRQMAVIDQPYQEIFLAVPAKVDRVRINPLRAVPGKFS